MLKFRLSEFFDKLLLLMAMLVFLFIGMVSFFSARNLDTLTKQNRPMVSSNLVNVEKVEVDLDSRAKAIWSSPVSQERGEDWVFDVFTPPVIYYNPLSREFTVTPPEMLAKVQKREDFKQFGLELIDVSPRPYHLQLVGYAGDEGNYTTLLEYVDTNEILKARPDTLLVEAGVKVLDFEVKQLAVSQEGAMPVFEKVGVVTLLDFASGQELVLTNAETKIFSDLEATIRFSEDGQTLVVKAGEQIEKASGFFIIGDLSSEPPEAMVTRISRDGERRQSRLLTPASKDNSLNDSLGDSNSRHPFAIRPKSRSGPQG